MNMKVLAFILASLAMTAGCLGFTDDPPAAIEEPIVIFSESYYNETYVFNNTIQMGYTSVHDYNITVNESIMVDWKITCRFESDILNDAGFVNLTLLRDNEVIMSGEYTSEQTAEFNATLDTTNATNGTYTLEIRSVGNDHALTDGLNDYYIIETVIYYI